MTHKKHTPNSDRKRDGMMRKEMEKRIELFLQQPKYWYATEEEKEEVRRAARQIETGKEPQIPQVEILLGEQWAIEAAQKIIDLAGERPSPVTKAMECHRQLVAVEAAQEAGEVEFEGRLIGPVIDSIHGLLERYENSMTMDEAQEYLVLLSELR